MYKYYDNGSRDTHSSVNCGGTHNPPARVARREEERVSQPILFNSERQRSGQRGMSRALLFGVKAFYAQRGALDTSMQDIVNERSFTFSACELTKSTGLSLTYQERNII